jgi:hypothetical protein
MTILVERWAFGVFELMQGLLTLDPDVLFDSAAGNAFDDFDSVSILMSTCHEEKVGLKNKSTRSANAHFQSKFFKARKKRKKSIDICSAFLP